MNSSEEYGIYEEREALHQPCVLFVDYNGFWAPLVALYWSTSSRILVSRHPYSCIEEIISQFCPQCLSRYMEDEVRSSQNTCPACFQCPCCAGILIRQTDRGGFPAWCCSGCQWRTATVDASTSTAANDQFNCMLKSLKEEESSLGSHRPLPKPSRTGRRWKMSDLESSLESKETTRTRDDDIQSRAEVSLMSHINSDEQLTNITQRLANPGLQQSLVADLVPIRFQLRSKRTIRCRRDVEEGKMSILVQPKLFPLEGDSSQNLQRGKWFVKNSSAVLEFPSIVITKLPDCKVLRLNGTAYLCVTFTNPIDDKLNIKINSASCNKSLDDFASKNIDLSSRGSRPFSCPIEYIRIENNEQDINFELGPFEDELLRDDNDEESDDIGFPDDFNITSPEMISNGWSCRMYHNVAHLMMKVTVISSSSNNEKNNDNENDNGEKEKRSSVYVLPLFVTTEKSDEASRASVLNGFQFQSVIAFPNID